MNEIVEDKEKAVSIRANAIGKMFELEASIMARDDCVVVDDMPYNHWFAPGLYGREITIPADTVLTTRIHASEHIAIISKGKLDIFGDDGSITVEAPHTMITKIGTKRAIYTHTETVFTTIHTNPDNETDIDKLVDKLTFKNEECFQKFLEDGGAK